ncbi:MAG: hypothetical protein FWG02_08765 [Holophagaceae bacterium]|nr:hypothetical protein [Holophagaceae bacterium]
MGASLQEAYGSGESQQIGWGIRVAGGAFREKFDQKYLFGPIASAQTHPKWSQKCYNAIDSKRM